jgi:hypothetical protein
MMRTVLWIFISILCCHSFAWGQVGSSPGVEILKHGWDKVRIDWMKDPLMSPTGENFYEMRTRVSTERRQRSAMEERNISAAREEKQKPPPPPRYVFEYRLTIQNTGPKTIKEIDWDYVFIDSVTGEALGRREFTSVEKVAAGKRKELKVTVSAPPTNRVSVHALGKNEHDGITERIVISRIMFDDDSTWRWPTWPS